MGGPADGANTDGYWKQHASRFSGLYGLRQRVSLRQAVARFLDRRSRVLEALADWEASARVLDLGCGSGIHLRQFAPRSRHLVGVDYSVQMLELARRELAGLDARWSLACADGHALPFPAACFEVVVSMGLLDYVRSPARVLAECRRVLRPGGSLILSAPKRPSAFFWLRTPPGDWLKASLFDLPPVLNVLSRAQLLHLLKDAGFTALHLSAVWTTMWMAKARADGP